MIASEVIPTLVASTAFLLRHLLAGAEAPWERLAEEGDSLGDE